MRIERQKEIAKTIYSNLKIIDPHCILAGGAPRDWYFGHECNDLDFYFTSTASTIDRVRGQLEHFFGEVSLHMHKERGWEDPIYSTMTFIRRIWEFVFEGQKIQLIELVNKNDTFKVVDEMDISICQCWYNFQKDQIVRHKNFKITEASKIMFLKDGVQWYDKHPQKMKERFDKKLYCGTKDQAINAFVRNVLDDL